MLVDEPFVLDLRVAADQALLLEQDVHGVELRAFRVFRSGSPPRAAPFE